MTPRSINRRRSASPRAKALATRLRVPSRGSRSRITRQVASIHSAPESPRCRRIAAHRFQTSESEFPARHKITSGLRGRNISGTSRSFHLTDQSVVSTTRPPHFPRIFQPDMKFECYGRPPPPIHTHTQSPKTQTPLNTINTNKPNPKPNHLLPPTKIETTPLSQTKNNHTTTTPHHTTPTHKKKTKQQK